MFCNFFTFIYAAGTDAAVVQRCVDCIANYYRKSNDCFECSSYMKPLLIVLCLSFICGGLVLLIGNWRWQHNTKTLGHVNTALYTLQFISMVGSVDAKWPAPVKSLLNAISFFNLDIDVGNSQVT